MQEWKEFVDVVTIRGLQQLRPCGGLGSKERDRCKLCRKWHTGGGSTVLVMRNAHTRILSSIER